MRLPQDKSVWIDQSGATLVEAAIVLPCVVFFFFAIIQATILVTGYVAATEAASVAARDTVAAAGGMVVPFPCSVNALDKMQRELDRFVIPARVSALQFTPAVNSSGVAGYELQATIQIQCPLCMPAFGLGSTLSNLGMRHFVPAENIASCS